MPVVGVPWYELRTDYPDLVTKALPVAGSRAAVGADSDPTATAWQLLVEYLDRSVLFDHVTH
jgi:hypothetical protein